MKKRIVIIDDHPIVRQGFTQLINQEDDLIVVGEAEDAAGAFDLIERIKPDLALIDLSLKNSNGIELIKDISRIYPDFLMLVISLHEESVYAERSLRAGAKGFIMKAEATENVMTAIRAVLQGDIYLSDSMRNRLLHSITAGGNLRRDKKIEEYLSDRELQVLQAVGRGESTKAIAEDLNLSIKTIETYKSHLKQKLSLRNSTELMQYAVEWYLTNVR
jgi:DNA-binding NarL/FixJ family response regulator